MILDLKFVMLSILSDSLSYTLCNKKAIPPLLDFLAFTKSSLCIPFADYHSLKK